MFKINKLVYKVFESGIALTPEENNSKLLSINENDIILKTYDSKITFIPDYESLNNYGKKDDTYNEGLTASKKVQSSDGKDETRFSMAINYFDTYDIGGFPMTIYQIRALVEAYKKSLGIWFRASRTISCDLKIAVDAETTSGWERNLYYHQHTGTSTSYTYDVVLEGGVISIGYWSRYNMHFGGYDSWGDTPSTPTAYLQKNTLLFW